MSRDFKIFLAMLLLLPLAGFVVEQFLRPRFPPPHITPARTVIATFTTALNMFQVDCGRFPTKAEGLNALINRPPTIPAGIRWQRYLDVGKIPDDPWGHPYIYECPGLHNPDHYDVYSLGINGRGGDEAIGNWTPPDK